MQKLMMYLYTNTYIYINYYFLIKELEIYKCTTSTRNKNLLKIIKRNNTNVHCLTL